MLRAWEPDADHFVRFCPCTVGLISPRLQLSMSTGNTRGKALAFPIELLDSRGGDIGYPDMEQAR